MIKRHIIIISLFLSFVLTDTVSSSEAQSPNDGGVTLPDVYALDYECDSITTSGMAMWAVAMKQKEDTKVVALTQNIVKGRKASLSVALKNEAACWDKASATINRLNMDMLELQYWFGGTIGTVAKAFVQLNVSYIRRASLEDDMKCLEVVSGQASKDYADIGEKALYESVNSVIGMFDIANVDSALFTDYCGSKADYMQRLSLCRQNALRLEADIQCWLNARKKVESRLSRFARKSYRQHTCKVVKSLTLCVKNNVEGSKG